jgi:hypothetical protein
VKNPSSLEESRTPSGVPASAGDFDHFVTRVEKAISNIGERGEKRKEREKNPKPRKYPQKRGGNPDNPTLCRRRNCGKNAMCFMNHSQKENRQQQREQPQPDE